MTNKTTKIPPHFYISIIILIKRVYRVLTMLYDIVSNNITIDSTRVGGKTVEMLVQSQTWTMWIHCRLNNFLSLTNITCA